MANSPQIFLNRPLGKQLTQSSFCQGLLRCAYPVLLMKINVGFAQATALVMGAFLRRVALNALNQESTYRRSL